MKYSVLFIVFTMVSLSLAQPNYNTVDAVSSASRKYGISSGKAYADSAVLTVKNAYRNGTLGLKWGKTTAMSDGSKAVSVSTSAPIARIAALTKSTKYYFQLYGTWNGRNYPNLGSGSFTTYGTATAIGPQTNKKISGYSITSCSLREIVFVAPVASGVAFSLCTVNGREIVSIRNTCSAGRNTIDLSGTRLTQGIYIIKLSSAGATNVHKLFLNK